MGDLSDWIHFDAIQALVHHATAVIVAIFLFGVTARLIAYLIPNGHAKKIVIIIDDVILLAVFALAGWRLLVYMWHRPEAEAPPEQTVKIARPASETGALEALIAQCQAQSAGGGELERCLTERNLQAQQALEKAAARMKAEMRALDRVGSSKIGAARSFETAQQAFAQYRDAECRWRSTSANNGASAAVYQACMASLAHRRAAQIEEILRR